MNQDFPTGRTLYASYSGPDPSMILCGAGKPLLTLTCDPSLPWEKLAEGSFILRQGSGEMTFWDSLLPDADVFRRVVRSHFYTRLYLSAPAETLMGYDFGAGKRDCARIVTGQGADELRIYLLCGGCVSWDGEAIAVSPGEGRLALICTRPEDEKRRLSAAITTR